MTPASLPPHHGIVQNLISDLYTQHKLKHKTIGGNFSLFTDTKFQFNFDNYIASNLILMYSIPLIESIKQLSQSLSFVISQSDILSRKA